MNDRVDSKGNKVLFVEEMQSDWAQQGKREKGYKQDESKLGLEPLLKAEELELEEGKYAYTYKKRGWCICWKRGCIKHERSAKVFG